MVIDRATGTLSFDAGVTIGPALTRSAFMQSPVGETQEVWVRNGPWCSWRVTRLTATGRTFLAVLQFHSEHLKSVELVESGQVGLSSWSDWSEVDELKKKALYDAFLSTELGVDRSFSWGSVSAIYDARSGSSSIHVKYG
jgi:hypothetical protein